MHTLLVAALLAATPASDAPPAVEPAPVVDNQPLLPVHTLKEPLSTGPMLQVPPSSPALLPVPTPSTGHAHRAIVVQKATSSWNGLFGWVGVTAGTGNTLLEPGAAVHVAASYRLHWVEPEVLVETGVFGGNYHQRFSFGSRLYMPAFVDVLDDIRPFVSLAFTHVHETYWMKALGDPVGAFFSTTAAHLNGVEGGVGVLLPIDVLVRPDQQQRYDVMVRLSMAYLPSLLAMSMPGMNHHQERVYAFVEASAAIPLFEPPAAYP